MSMMDLFGINKKLFGGAAGGPLDNRLVQGVVMGPQALLPSNMQMASPWMGMAEQDADNDAQLAQRQKVYGDLATGG